MSVERYLVTRPGYEKLLARRRVIREHERPENVRDIEEARAHGDLSENAEYHAAKDHQGLLAAELRMIEDKLSRIQVIDPKDVSGEKVCFGATVTVLDLDSDIETTYYLVGEEEADVKAGLIFYKSPIARGMMGKEVGDECEVRAPAGVRKLEILDLEFK
jgi:transcription elongation factor GreA